jgi:hypothetical protein
MVVGMNRPGRRYTEVMANFTSKVQELLHSPKARQMIDKARLAANKPENREKVRQLSSKFTNRGHGTGGSGGHGVPGEHPAGPAGTSNPIGNGAPISSSRPPETSGQTGTPGPIGGDGRGTNEREPSDYGPF